MLLFLFFQWLVGNIVQRDDALFPRMKQRDLGGHDTMWEPIFMDDAAIGLGEQKNKVPKCLSCWRTFTYCTQRTLQLNIHKVWRSGVVQAVKCVCSPQSSSFTYSLFSSFHPLCPHVWIQISVLNFVSFFGSTRPWTIASTNKQTCVSYMGLSVWTESRA